MKCPNYPNWSLIFTYWAATYCSKSDNLPPSKCLQRFRERWHRGQLRFVYAVDFLGKHLLVSIRNCENSVYAVSWRASHFLGNGYIFPAQRKQDMLLTGCWNNKNAWCSLGRPNVKMNVFWSCVRKVTGIDREREKLRHNSSNNLGNFRKYINLSKIDRKYGRSFKLSSPIRLAGVIHYSSIRRWASQKLVCRQTHHVHRPTTTKLSTRKSGQISERFGVDTKMR